MDAARARKVQAQKEHNYHHIEQAPQLEPKNMVSLESRGKKEVKEKR